MRSKFVVSFKIDGRPSYQHFETRRGALSFTDALKDSPGFTDFHLTTT